MPKELKEIRNFTEGTILNASERDVSQDTNVYSLNINPIAEHGILDAIKVDKLISTIDGKDTYFRDPVSWSATNNTDAAAGATSYNYPGIYIEDISVFDNEGVTKLNFIGTQGRKEQLLVKSIEPVFESTGSTLDPTADFIETDTYIEIASADFGSKLSEGEYFSLTDGGDAFTGRYGNHEILRMESYDATAQRLYVKRRCFGTSSSNLLNSEGVHDLRAGRITIDSVQATTTAGTALLSGWSDYSGNNIGGNSHYLNFCDNTDATDRESNGLIVTNNSTKECIFDATAKTLTLGTAANVGTSGDVNFHEGDIITCYYNHGTEANNGKSFTILKKDTGPLVLTLDENLGETLQSEEVDANNLYIESNLIKNFTFSHAIDVTGAYKFNNWIHRSLTDGTNYYADDTGVKVVWSHAVDTVFKTLVPPYTTSTGYSDNFYPFIDSDATAETVVDKVAEIISEFGAITPVLKEGTALTTSSTELEFKVGTGDMGQYLAEGDIISWDGGGVDSSSEYMRVESINGAIVTVTRGALGSTPEATHLADDAAPFKCVNHNIQQAIAKEKLKEGQEYVLSFYAGKVDANAYGGLSISFNGGYINSSGIWTPFKNDPKSGYLDAGSENHFSTEYRWIDFSALDKINGDIADNPSGIDDVWRRLDFRFTIPKGQKLETDVLLEIASRGRNTSILYVDRVTLNEHTKVYASIEDGNRINNTSFIDDADLKTLVVYDANQNKLSAISNFSLELADSTISTPLLSSDASPTVNSATDSATFVRNNREVHVGFGGNEGDSPPQWLGYVNHQVFGEDYTDVLYQDEDTVHSYDDTGVSGLSKICVAGEHEYVATASFGSQILHVTFTHADKIHLGDNLVMREWLDGDNSWEGNGIWVVTDTASSTTAFQCKRLTTVDADPSGVPTNSKISFRPYYYYGCKDGDDRLYRINPSTLLTTTPALSTTYTAGTIEGSVALPGPIASICTCYAKESTNDTAATNGGYIYALSSNSTSVYVLHVGSMAYDKWTTDEIPHHILTLGFKSFKWSNDNANGNIGGDTEVFPGAGLAAQSSPSIDVAGQLSDIIETKGTNTTFDVTTTSNTTNHPNDFDTRLWVQARPGGGATFSEGDRFLFCGLTDEDNSTSTGTIYLGDRTPPTTAIMGGWGARYGGTDERYLGGPGIDLINGGAYKEYGYFSNTNDAYRIDAIRPISDGVSAYAAGLESSGGKHHSYFNFGWNVGWSVDEGELPSIYVAKYGLFQMGDNDMDGLIDSTGVVCANSTSITAANRGSYGRLHRRVTSHVVGLVGGSNTPWARHWGAMLDTGGETFWFGAKAPTGGWDSGDLAGNLMGNNYQDAPENMPVNNCIFVCSDIHLGDIYPTAKQYTSTAITAVDNTGVTNNNDGMRVEIDDAEALTLQAGDLVYCEDTGTESNSFNSYIADINGDEIIMPFPNPTIASGELELFPHTPHPQWQKNAATDPTGEGDGCILQPTHHIFHYAFDKDNPDNGDIYTQGKGCGKYGRSFITTPSQHGYSGDETDASIADDTGFKYNPQRPGFLSCIEKLNYKAGYMIRPFDTDAESFRDLIVGNSLSVSIPTFPNPVYHVNDAAGNLSYSINGGAAVNNQFASKLFIASKLPATEGTIESKIYKIDMNLMYPDEGLHTAVIDTEGDSTSDDFNRGTIWDIEMAGNVISYTSASANTVTYHTPITNGTEVARKAFLHATHCPVVVVKGTTTNMFYNHEMLGTYSPYRNDGALAGMCISIVDQDTGVVQTRYINYSQNHETGGTGGNNGMTDSSELYIHVHYPFEHAPVAGDKWYIWKHGLVCTAPVRLYKETPLGHGLGNALLGDKVLESPIYKESGTISAIEGDTTDIDVTTGTTHHNLSIGDVITVSGTSNYNNNFTVASIVSPIKLTLASTSHDYGAETGTWTLLDNTGSPANPLALELVNPVIDTTFGGLDMRKLRSYTTSGTPDFEANAVAADLTITTTGHLLSAGDTITADGARSEHDGTYIITSVNTNDFDVQNDDTTDDATTGTIYSNQWESFVLETGGKGRVGELRSGLNSWDKGNTQDNIIRYDTTADASRFMALSEASVTITSGSLGDETGDYFLRNNTYRYKVSLIYDGYQEGPLSESSWTMNDTETRSIYNVKIKMQTYSKRLSHVCLYRRNNSDSFYSLVKQIPVKSGWGFIANEGSWVYTVGDSGELGATYESRTGLSEVLDTIKLKYGISAEVDGYLFAGDCGHELIKNASNLIFRSKPGMFSIFDYANDFLTIKSKPTAMANFLGRLYVFDNNNIYKINQHNLAIEDIFEGVGCLGKDSLIVTEYGMFFADSNGAYKHDGNSPVKISEPIQDGGDTITFGIGETVSPTDNINDVSWNNAVAKRGAIPFVTFDSSGSNVLFILKYNDKSTSTVQSLNYTKNVEQYYAWSYNISRNRWDLWELDSNISLGVPFINSGGEVILPIDNALYELQGGSNKKDYTWISKKLNIDNDSTLKIFKKIKVNGITSDLNLGGSNKESSDRLFVSTSKGTIASSDLTYSTPSTSHSNYALGGSNKSARWLQIKFENMTEPVDSLGIIFRRKRVK